MPTKRSIVERIFGTAILGFVLFASVGMANPATVPTQNPRVLFITTRDCPACEAELARLQRPGGDFERMRSRGWRIGTGTANHLQIIDVEQVSDLAPQLNVRSYPAVVGMHNGGIVRSFASGCTTPLDAWTFGWLATGIDARPRPAILEAISVQTTGHFPLRGNHWSINGEWNPSRQTVIAHLRGLNHARQSLKFGNIESWSFEELRSLHDYLHEQEMTAVASAQLRVGSRPQPVSQMAASNRHASSVSLWKLIRSAFRRCGNDNSRRTDLAEHAFALTASRRGWSVSRRGNSVFHGSRASSGE